MQILDRTQTNRTRFSPELIPQVFLLKHALEHPFITTEMENQKFTDLMLGIIRRFQNSIDAWDLYRLSIQSLSEGWHIISNFLFQVVSNRISNADVMIQGVAEWVNDLGDLAEDEGALQPCVQARESTETLYAILESSLSQVCFVHFRLISSSTDAGGKVYTQKYVPKNLFVTSARLLDNLSRAFGDLQLRC